jgi:hypothetical protein
MTSDLSLPPWCRRLLAELTASDARAIATARPLSMDQLNWRPRPDSWSVGQCLEHLAVTNEVYCEAIAAAVPGCTKNTVDEITPGWFGAWFIRSYIAPSPATKRARAPKKAAPARHVEASVLDRFLKSNDAARALVRRASDCDVNRVRFRNPFLSIIRFTIGTGLEIIARHEDRHLLQAERVREAADSVKRTSHTLAASAHAAYIPPRE